MQFAAFNSDKTTQAIAVESTTRETSEPDRRSRVLLPNKGSCLSSRPPWEPARRVRDLLATLMCDIDLQSVPGLKRKKNDLILSITNFQHAATVTMT